MAHHQTTAQPPRLATWPLWLLALPAGVAIWSGWVGLGQLTGFGPVTLLPGISDFQINTAVTLPIGMEAYAAYALRAWLSGRLPERAERFARRSAIGALALGAAGQAFYHLLAASGVDQAPWPLTVFVSVLPVLVLGMGAALAHLINTTPYDTPATEQPEPQPDEGRTGQETQEPFEVQENPESSPLSPALASPTGARRVNGHANGTPRPPQHLLDGTPAAAAEPKRRTSAPVVEAEEPLPVGGEDPWEQESEPVAVPHA